MTHLAGAAVPLWGKASAVAAALPEHLRLHQLHLFHGGRDNTVASLFRFLKSVGQPIIGAFGGGELTKKLTVSVDKVTESAKQKIEAIGGKVEVK